MTTASQTAPAARTSRRPWLTASWIGLILIGLFYVFGAVSDLAGDAGKGIPSDHAVTFGKMAGTTFAAAKTASPGTAHYITLLERGYAIHELVFAILFLVILVIPFRARQRWAWWTCWALTIANLGYALTFGAHDSKVLSYSLVALIGLPVLLVVHAREFFRTGPDNAA